MRAGDYFHPGEDCPLPLLRASIEAARRVRGRRFPSSAKRVYLAIARAAVQHGAASMSQAALAAAVGCSRDRVWWALRFLRDVGLIESHAGGQHRPNQFWLRSHELIQEPGMFHAQEPVFHGRSPETGLLAKKDRAPGRSEIPRDQQFTSGPSIALSQSKTEKKEKEGKSRPTDSRPWVATHAEMETLRHFMASHVPDRSDPEGFVWRVYEAAWRAPSLQSLLDVFAGRIQARHKPRGHGWFLAVAQDKYGAKKPPAASKTALPSEWQNYSPEDKKLWIELVRRGVV